MPLTQLAIVKASTYGKARELPAGDGLHLLVQPGGRKLRRFRYRFAGRENMLSFGAFPTNSLADARGKREEARKLIAEGTDPAAKKRLDKLAAANAAQSTFGAIASEYLEHLAARGAAETTMTKNRWMLQELISPLSRRPIAEISAAEVLDVLKRIEKSGRRETARKLRGAIGSVFRLAVATVRAPADPTIHLRGALLRPNVEHHPAITDERRLGELTCSIDEYDGWPTIRAALQLLALTMMRPGDIRGMRRSEVDFDRAIWSIPAVRMKMRRPHQVPLSRQAIEILRDIWPLSDYGELVLPSVRSNKKPLSENSMNSALRRMGYVSEEMCSHGFRAAASSILNGRGFDPDVIEAALAHQDKNAIRRTYNRATYWPERTKLIQTWADMLDDFRKRAVAEPASSITRQN